MPHTHILTTFCYYSRDWWAFPKSLLLKTQGNEKGKLSPKSYFADMFPKYGFITLQSLSGLTGLLAQRAQLCLGPVSFPLSPLCWVLETQRKIRPSVTHQRALSLQGQVPSCVPPQECVVPGIRASLSPGGGELRTRTRPSGPTPEGFSIQSGLGSKVRI